MASTLAERFAEARRLRGLKVNELDRLANRSSASRVGRGERAKLSPEVLADYARALGVRHEWLATGQEPRDPEAVSDLPHSPADRARLAARALGYAPDVIDSALATPPADADARALFALIVRAEGASVTPIHRPTKVIEAGKPSPDDALAALDAEETRGER